MEEKRCRAHRGTHREQREERFFRIPVPESSEDDELRDELECG